MRGWTAGAPLWTARIWGRTAAQLQRTRGFFGQVSPAAFRRAAADPALDPVQGRTQESRFQAKAEVCSYDNHRDHAGKPPPRRQQDREVLIP
jgi:hypothetical protein